MVSPSDTTLSMIRKKVRRITSSPSESSLPTSEIDIYINNFYNTEFPYAIKTDQMRSVYTFFTSPNIDKYPVNINYNQGFRSPVYFEGVKGYYYQDREEFYDIYPRWPTEQTLGTGDGVTTNFTPTISGAPFLRNEVVIGTVDSNDDVVRVSDNGEGILYLNTPNVRQSIPLETDVDPGMKNINTSPAVSGTDQFPGDNVLTDVGTVNYETGAINITFPVAPKSNEEITIQTYQYSAGRPYSLLFWNNNLFVRPVPDKVYKVEVESFLSPVQFLNTTDVPIVNQWWEYIALGAAIKILTDRQDFDGVSAVKPEFERQAGLILERQSVEEIGMRNTTIFTESVNNPGYYWNQGWF